ncbi:MAG: TIGR03084 family metal-binding protein [Acidimicrobiia bacterium]
MNRLPPLDGMFLMGEQRAWPMHVGALMVFDGDALDAARYRAFVESRLPYLPALRRRTVPVPFALDRPVWEDDAAVDLDHHVRARRVRAPGDARAVARTVASLLAKPLDHRRPLWEAWFLDGMPDDEVAVLFKVHHAAAGGFTGMRVLEHLCDLEPDPDLPPPRTVRGTPAPSRLRLAGEGLVSVGTLPWRIVRLAPTLTRSALGLARFRLSPDWASATLPFQAPRTSLNGSVTPERSAAYCSVPLAEVKAVKNAFDVTVNDVVLAMLASALRGYLSAHGEHPTKPLVAQLPVATHAGTGIKTVAGNHMMLMGAAMATDLADPVERLRTIHRATDSGKDLEAALGDELLTQLFGVMPLFVVRVATRLYTDLHLAELMPPVFSLIVSDVPGPPVPLYSAGARIRRLYPFGPLFEGSGLNVTVASYVDAVDFGFLACPARVDDVESIARGTEEALAELVARLPKAVVAPAPRPSKDEPMPEPDATLRALADDLLAEEAALDELVADLPDDRWGLATPAPGWAIRDQIGHLAYAEDLAALAASDEAAFSVELARALDDLGAYQREIDARVASMAPSELLAWWRASRAHTIETVLRHDPATRIAWMVTPMSPRSFLTARLMETWAHGRDVADALGVEPVPTDRLLHVASLGVRTRAFSYANRGLAVPDAHVRVELDAPDGTVWAWGPVDATDRITGSSVDFCLVVTQRRNVADTALRIDGRAAAEWMNLAQAFAGPPTRRDPAPPGVRSTR